MSKHAPYRLNGMAKVGGSSGWRPPRTSCRRCGKHAELGLPYERGVIAMCGGCYRVHRSRFDGQPVANYSPFRPLGCRTAAEAKSGAVAG